MAKIVPENLELPSDCESFFLGEILVIKKWHFDFSACLKLQKSCQEAVRTRKLKAIYLFVNHPHCFTLGRGNERGQGDLLEFDPAIREKLSFPLFDIHRGGGLTYHYPGQWIFYPIIKITPQYSLNDHMCWLLRLIRDYLQQTYELPAIATQKIMGVWIHKKKIASIGVGLNRFVTEHGIAFNLNEDTLMSQELLKINPCGLKPQTYTFLNKELRLTNIPVESFHQGILQQLVTSEGL